MKITIALVLLLSSIFRLNAVAQNIEEELSYAIGGRSRVYHLFFPETLKENAPLVFVLHEYGGSASDMIQFSGMNNVAEKHGFALCYPQGNLGVDKKYSWNAGYSNDDVDDVKFLSHLAAFLQTKFKLSKQNTFCTGMSNGADMCYLLACNCPDVFSAIAPVAGCMMESTFKKCNPAKAIPVFEIHGTNDTITLWMGDSEYSEKYGAYLGTKEVVGFWIKKNDCQQSQLTVLPDVNINDSSYVVAEKYIGGFGGNQVWLYTLIGGGHDWPGSWGNMDVVAAEEIGNFFQQFVNN